MPDHSGLYSFAFGLWYYPFLKPSDWFPAFELDDDLIGVDIFEKIQEDVALDSISRKVKLLIDFDKTTCHLTKIYNAIKSINPFSLKS